MKNTRTLLGIVAVVGLIGFVTVSCDNATNATSVAIYHTVSFDTGAGGSSVASVQVRDGYTVARLATNPTRAGYNFVNWYGSAAGGSPFNFATQITADLTVFARWAAVSTCEDCECDYCADCGCAEDGACGSDCLCYVPRGNFVRVRGGSFQMGCLTTCCCTSPVRTVTVSGFYMGVFPVTQGEWYDVMGDRPSWFTGETCWNGNPVTGVNWRNLPVEQVSWFDAVEFANALSIQAGLDPAYTINGTTVTWNRYANGYRDRKSVV